MSAERVHIFGIRHHGPGSARSLERALQTLRPDCLLIEGPPDADSLLPLAPHAEMIPPVAILVYVPDNPRRAAFFPFARFSPEWRAILHGQAEGVPTRFIDLPQWHQLVDADEGEGTEEETANELPAEGPAEPLLHHDPLGMLAREAGYSDGERWWDHLVESRRYSEGDLFAEVRDAMAALREELPPRDRREEQREAYMRKSIRAALKEGFERIAVVCGAWHAPALDPARFPPATHDNQLLAGLQKVKTQAAWSPWTYDRLATSSGYGAGVVSPEWYELLWTEEGNVAIKWMTRVAQLLRQRDLDTSSAHVIEGVRLSESLAALRNRPLPGLEELEQGALAVVCEGNEAPLALIRRKLIVGERLGAIPQDSPMAPLQRDLTALQKRLRMPASSSVKPYDLDLRKPIDLERSHLLHRLNLLGVPWGDLEPLQTRARGTFHEVWRVKWEPEFTVALVEASHFGNTIEQAASARVMHVASEARALEELTGLLNDALLAELPQGVEALVGAIQRRASTGSDVPQLMAAVPALARASRYGNVRQTDASLVEQVLVGIVERVCIGLPAICRSINDDAAAELFERIEGVHGSLTLAEGEMLERWLAALELVARQEGAHLMLRGRALRLLHEARRVETDELSQQMGFALSPAVPRAEAAAWIEGFLRGSGLVLVHDEGLWEGLNSWVAGLSADEFTEVLPLLRRTFSTFPVGERRQMGERVKRGGSGVAARASASLVPFDHDRAATVLPVLEQLLGPKS